MGWGKNETWKIVYVPKVLNNGMRGVALVEARDRQEALYTFMQQYAGQFHTVDTCERLLG